MAQNTRTYPICGQPTSQYMGQLRKVGKSNYVRKYQRKGQNRSEKKYRRNRIRAKLYFESDSSINILFLSTYFRGEVDILAGLCYNRYPRKATKHEKLNDKKRLRLVPSRNLFLNCMFDFTKGKGYFNFTFKPK